MSHFRGEGRWCYPPLKDKMRRKWRKTNIIFVQYGAKELQQETITKRTVTGGATMSNDDYIVI